MHEISYEHEVAWCFQQAPFSVQETGTNERLNQGFWIEGHKKLNQGYGIESQSPLFLLVSR